MTATSSGRVRPEAPTEDVGGTYDLDAQAEAWIGIESGRRNQTKVRTSNESRMLKEGEIDALIAKPSVRLSPYLGYKPISRREARGAIRKLQVYETTHTPVPDDQRLEILTSLVLVRRSRDVAGVLHLGTDNDEQKSRRTTWDDQVLASLAPCHKLVKRINRAWEMRPL